MMSSTADKNDTKLILSAVARLSRDQLIDKWKMTYKCQPPKGISSLLLERSDAYQTQVDAHGGLNVTTKRTLRAMQTSGKRCQPTVPNRAANPDLAPGIRLVREWNGRTFSVDVIEGGFVWNGRVYRSLSAIARNITGTRWSGPRFFGL